MKHYILPALLCLAPFAAPAQNTTVGGPVSGIVFDRQAQALRPMLGVPGSSYLGGNLAGGLDEAAVAPDGTAALAVSQGRLLLFANLGTAAEGTAIDGAIEGVDRIVWSPGGNFAAVYSTARAQAQVVRDARGSAAAGVAVDLPGTVLSLAVSNGGDLVAGTEGGVYLLAAGNAPRLIAAATAPVALTVRGTDLYVADSAAGCIRQVANFASSAAATVFADGVASPVGVQLSSDGNRLFAAGAGEKQLYVYDASSRAALGTVALDSAPTGLSVFGGRDVWLLNSTGSGTGPLYVATGGNTPAAWFVPVGREQ